MTDTITIYADGGCINNNTKTAEREAYASIKVTSGDRTIKIKPDWVKSFADMDVSDPRDILTIKLENASSNNEAEFAAAIMALGYVKELIKRNPGRQLPNVTVKMDSDLVVQSINGDKKIKAKNLVSLHYVAATVFLRVQEHLKLTFEWMDNKEMKAILGH